MLIKGKCNAHQLVTMRPEDLGKDVLLHRLRHSRCYNNYDIILSIPPQSLLAEMILGSRVLTTKSGFLNIIPLVTPAIDECSCCLFLLSF